MKRFFLFLIIFLTGLILSRPTIVETYGYEKYKKETNKVRILIDLEGSESEAGNFILRRAVYSTPFKVNIFLWPMVEDNIEIKIHKFSINNILLHNSNNHNMEKDFLYIHDVHIDDGDLIFALEFKVCDLKKCEFFLHSGTLKFNHSKEIISATMAALTGI